jgi:hypothetical protein
MIDIVVSILDSGFHEVAKLISKIAKGISLSTSEEFSGA